MAVDKVLIRNPIGYNMDVLAERLQHLENMLDLDSWKTIFDIGACNGWEGVNFAKVFSDARVYSFEPSVANHVRCADTYSKQIPDVVNRITLVKAALTDATGLIEFYAIDEEQAGQGGNVNHGMGSILEIVDPRILPWEYSIQKKEMVSGYSLDDWCEQNLIQSVDALWVDVQGAELHVFKGAEKQLANVQAIMTEAGLEAYYHGHTMKTDIDQFLSSLGFRELTEARQYHAQGLEVNAIYVNQRFIR